MWRHVSRIVLSAMSLPFFLSLGMPANGEPVSELLASSRIVKVIVYSDRALVTRRADQTLKEGVQRVVFQDLPPALLPESIRISGTGESEVIILGKNTRTKPMGESRATEKKRLGEEIAALGEKIQELDDKRATLEESLEDIRFLGKNLGVPPPRSERSGEREEWVPLTPGNVPPPGAEEEPGSLLPQYKQLQDLRAVRLKLRKELRELNPQETALKQQLERRKEELAALGALADIEGFEVSVDVQVAKQGQVQLDLLYMVPGASWRPVYDARYLKAKNQIALSYDASVRQRTGEDWNDVELILSTSKPHFGGRPRTLQPWYVRLPASSPPPAPAIAVETNGQTKRNGAEKTQTERVLAPKEGELESTGIFSFGPAPGASTTEGHALSENVPAVSGSGVETEFEAQQPASVESGGTEAKVSIADLQFDVEINRLSIPEQAPYAYIRASTRNASNLILMGGRVNVFFDSDFLSTSSITTTMPQGGLELFLGPDPRIEVERKILERSPDTYGVFDKDGELTLRYRIRLTNRSEDPLDVEVKERMPVPVDQDITVGNVRSDPKAVERSEQGTLTWHVSLSPSGTQEIEYSYRVRFPKGETPLGL